MTTHETRNTYFPEEAFDTFPFPSELASLKTLGRACELARRELASNMSVGLGRVYSAFHDKSAHSRAIADLRDLHVQIDQATLQAYSWSDLKLEHGFRQTRSGTRFTVSDESRTEIVDRLLELNHAHYAEEVAKGLHSNEARGKTAISKKADTLFDEE